MGEVPFALTVHVALIEAHERAALACARCFAAWGLTPQQYNAMRILYFAEPGGVRQSAIDEELLTRVPDVSRLVDRLERAGFARRSPDPLDRRAVLVELTAAGRARLEEMDADVMENHERWYSGLTAREQQHLLSLLRKTTAVIEAADTSDEHKHRSSA